MSETKRYRLPEQLGGGEVEIESVWFDMTATVTLMADTSMQFRLARQWLKEIPPPIPAEPEPGAYLIGGNICVRWDDDPDDECRWSCDHLRDYRWVMFWPKVGGPDVDIVPLVAKPAAVELPWRGGSGNTTVKVDTRGSVSWTTVDSNGEALSFVLGYNATRELGWALLSAADRAEAGE